MLDKETARQIAKSYSDEVRKIIDPVSVILFGSYANGNPHDESDIDVAVMVRSYEGDWFDTRVKLHGLKWKEALTDIEPHLFDLDDDPSGFARHIMKTGEVVYQSDK
jgi:predicted nucleotidyltransferase